MKYTLSEDRLKAALSCVLTAYTMDMVESESELQFNFSEFVDKAVKIVSCFAETSNESRK